MAADDGKRRLVTRHQSAPVCSPSSSSSSSSVLASARTSAAAQRGPLTPINAVNGPTRSTSNCRIDSGPFHGISPLTDQIDRPVAQSKWSTGRFAQSQIRPVVSPRSKFVLACAFVHVVIVRHSRSEPGRAGPIRALLCIKCERTNFVNLRIFEDLSMPVIYNCGWSDNRVEHCGLTTADDVV